MSYAHSRYWTIHIWGPWKLPNVFPSPWPWMSNFIGFVCIGHWVSIITLPVAKFYLNWSSMFQWQPYSGVGEKGRKITPMVRIFWSIVNFTSLAHQHLAYFSPYCTIFPAKQFEKRLHEVFEFWKQWKYEALTLLYHIKLHKKWRNP